MKALRFRPSPFNCQPAMIKRAVALPKRFQHGRLPVLTAPSLALALTIQTRFQSNLSKDVTGNTATGSPTAGAYDFSHIRCASKANLAAHVQRCETALDYKFRNKLLCFEALNLSLPAWIPHPDNPAFYRVLPPSSHLAILGDRLIYARMATAWYRQGATQYAPQAMATWEQVRATLPSNANLRRIALRHRLHSVVLTEKGGGLCHNISERAAGTTVEALLGAVFLDGGEECLDALMRRFGLFHSPMLEPVPDQVWNSAFLREAADVGAEVIESEHGEAEPVEAEHVEAEHVRQEHAEAQAVEADNVTEGGIGFDGVENDTFIEHRAREQGVTACADPAKQGAEGKPKEESDIGLEAGPGLMAEVRAGREDVEPSLEERPEPQKGHSTPNPSDGESVRTDPTEDQESQQPKKGILGRAKSFVGL
ncbi:hypothetical protein F5Y15DRAFT_398356 [Xylariaceae sp. FL0016]|nr:hypothetical protein F5Y15DRAFT_398356 [Xylariaceae sp. FL0016]